uniref:C-type lectin domain-containing protein n=1 Tax=Xiphophorus couchianus TaxID=32473 RepID=A0A3B5LQP9_9TELE
PWSSCRKRLLLCLYLSCFGSIQTSVSCPSGWTLINSRCFLYVPTDMTWANAEKNCLSMGANLASVHNMNEYRRVQNLISAAGHGHLLNSVLQEKTWFWSDGSPMTYTNWCLKQPDNKAGHQNCLQMNYSGKENCWDDVECHIRRPSVCAKKG